MDKKSAKPRGGGTDITRNQIKTTLIYILMTTTNGGGKLVQPIKANTFIFARASPISRAPLENSLAAFRRAISRFARASLSHSHPVGPSRLRTHPSSLPAAPILTDACKHTQNISTHFKHQYPPCMSLKEVLLPAVLIFLSRRSKGTLRL